MRTDADRAASKKHYEANREKRKAVTYAWREKNRARYNSYMRELRRKKSQ